MKNLETKLLVIITLLLGIIAFNLLQINSRLNELPTGGQIENMRHDISGLHNLLLDIDLK